MLNIAEILHLHQLNKKRINGTATFIYAMLMAILAFMCVFVSYIYMETRDQAQNVENSIALSLLGASRINMSEYGTTNQMVLHERMPDEYYNTLKITSLNDTAEMFIPAGSSLFNVHPEYTQEFAVSASDKDRYLEWSKAKFTELLKKNLDLDDNMMPKETSSNGAVLKPKYYDDSTGQYLDNKINIEEYTVINKYTYRDASAPYAKHTYTVVYRSENGGDFTVVSILSGKDKQTYISNESIGWEKTVDGGKCDGTKIETSSVYARISFYTSFGQDLSGNKYSQKQTVDRVVTIQEM